MRPINPLTGAPLHCGKKTLLGFKSTGRRRRRKEKKER
jgi:hypothetical protein